MLRSYYLGAQLVCDATLESRSAFSTPTDSRPSSVRKFTDDVLIFKTRQISDQKMQIMTTLLIVGIFAGIVIASWSMISGRKLISISVMCVVIAITFFLGFLLGRSLENIQNYDRYVWRFSQYSTHLRQLVEQQKINELTNDIVIFDAKFNKHQDWHDLQDVTFQILRVGPYFQDTNTSELDTQTNGTRSDQKQ